MTRKQAITMAISILSQKTENDEIVMKLQEILSELPLSTWTRNSIIDSIETYAYEHDNILPSAIELTTENKLPSSTVINKIFGLSSMVLFFKKYFPNFKEKDKSSSPYKGKDKDYFMFIFQENYEYIKHKFDIKYVTAKIYDKYKNTNTPCLNTITRNCNCKSYDELLVLCGYKKNELPIIATIKASFNDDRDVEYIRSIINEVKNRAR